MIGIVFSESRHLKQGPSWSNKPITTTEDKTGGAFLVPLEVAVCFNMAAVVQGETAASGIYWIKDSILSRCFMFFCSDVV